MPITALLELAGLVINLASGVTTGTVQKDLQLVAALEASASKVAKAHMDMVGTPLDVDSLKYEEPIQ